MWGETPSRPMIDWGIALTRWVIRLAPRRTASVATSVNAILLMCASASQQPSYDSTYLCRIENTIPRCPKSQTTSTTPHISGAAVMICTPTGASSSMSQSSLMTKFCAPNMSSNEANPFGADRMWRGAWAPRLDEGALCVAPQKCSAIINPFGEVILVDTLAAEREECAGRKQDSGETGSYCHSPSYLTESEFKLKLKSR
jgi:hypothetical protein